MNNGGPQRSSIFSGLLLIVLGILSFDQNGRLTAQEEYQAAADAHAAQILSELTQAIAGASGARTCVEMRPPQLN